MPIGLYGKVPTKRDFIAIAASREFLLAWEPWMQGGVSASTMRLGDGWKPAFLRAPIWRFWLGADICGETVTGAFMPSLDGIGRYFPLTLFARAERDNPIPPPELESHEAWFERVEACLLSTLDEGTTFETTLAELQALGMPSSEGLSSATASGQCLQDGTFVVDAAEGGFAAAFRSARMASHAKAYASSSFWWTAGGEGFSPTTLSQRLMPNPFVFIGMITGEFAQQD